MQLRCASARPGGSGRPPGREWQALVPPLPP